MELVARHSTHEIIGNRMVLRNKYSQEEILERRKARVLVRGFSQKPGIHFNETFAPVTCLGTFDVATTYFNGKLNEKILIEPPKLFREILEDVAVSDANNRELKIKAMNSLKQLSSGNIE
ncbi:hypothetical protein Trydic_g934 [Trypoxylus dichotomus]